MAIKDINKEIENFSKALENMEKKGLMSDYVARLEATSGEYEKLIEIIEEGNFRFNDLGKVVKNLSDKELKDAKLALNRVTSEFIKLTENSLKATDQIREETLQVTKKINIQKEEIKKNSEQLKQKLKDLEFDKKTKKAVNDEIKKNDEKIRILERKRRKEQIETIQEFGRVQKEVGTVVGIMTGDILSKLGDAAEKSKGIGKIFSNNIANNFGKILEKSHLKEEYNKALLDIQKNKGIFQQQEQQLDNLVKKRKEYSQRLAEAEAAGDADRYVEIGESLEGVISQIREAAEASRDASEGYKKSLAASSKTEEAYKKAPGAFSSGAKMAGTTLAAGGMKEIASVIKGLGGTLMKVLGPVADFAKSPILTLISMITESIMELLGSTSQFQKEMNMSATSAAKVSGALNASSDFMKMGPDAFKSMQESFSALTNYTNSFNHNIDSTVKLVSKINKLTGISTEESAKFVSDISRGWQMADEKIENMVMTMRRDAQAAGINFKFVMSDISKESSRVALYGQDIGEGIMRAALKARELGTELSTWTSATDTVSEWQGAVDVAMKFNVLAGKQVMDAQHLYLAGLEGDVEKVQDMFIKGLENVPEHLRKGKLGKDLAKAMGMSEEQYVKALQHIEVSKLVKDNLSKAMSGINKIQGDSIEKMLGATTPAMRKYLEDNKEKIGDLSSYTEKALTAAAKKAVGYGYKDGEDFLNAVYSGKKEGVEIFQKEMRNIIDNVSPEDALEAIEKSLTPQERMEGFLKSLVQKLVPYALDILSNMLQGIGFMIQLINQIPGVGGSKTVDDMATRFKDIGAEMKDIATGMKEQNAEKEKVSIEKNLADLAKHYNIQYNKDADAATKLAVAKKVEAEATKSGKPMTIQAAKDAVSFYGQSATKEKEKKETQKTGDVYTKIIKEAMDVHKDAIIKDDPDDYTEIQDLYRNRPVSKTDFFNFIRDQADNDTAKILKTIYDRRIKKAGDIAFNEGMIQYVVDKNQQMWELDPKDVASTNFNFSRDNVPTGQPLTKGSLNIQNELSTSGAAGKGDVTDNDTAKILKTIYDRRTKKAGDIAFNEGMIQYVVDKNQQMWELDPKDKVVASTNFNFSRDNVPTGQPLTKGSLNIQNELSTSGAAGKGDVIPQHLAATSPPSLIMSAKKNMLKKTYSDDASSMENIASLIDITAVSGGGKNVVKVKKPQGFIGPLEEYYLMTQGGGNPWSDKSYANRSTYAEGGCGPTSIAMNASSILGKVIPPDVIGENNKYMRNYGPEGGSIGSTFPKVYSSLGINGVKAATSLDKESVKKYFSEGNILSGHVKNHFVTWWGISEDGSKILTGDSAHSGRYKNYIRNFAFDTKGRAMEGPQYAVPTKNKAADMAYSSGANNSAMYLVDKNGNIYSLLNNEGLVVSPNINMDSKLSGKNAKFTSPGGIFEKVAIPQWWRDKAKELYNTDIPGKYIEDFNLHQLYDKFKDPTQKMSEYILKQLGYTDSEIESIKPELRHVRAYNELMYGVDPTVKKEWKRKDIDWYAFEMASRGENAGSSTQSVNFSTDFTEATKAMVKRHEGVRRKVYLDSRGYPTVGVGHLLNKEEKNKWPVGYDIGEEEVKRLWDRDFEGHAKDANKFPGFANMTKIRQAALIDLAFNMGSNWFKKFPSLVKESQTNNWQGVSTQLLNSAYAKQVKGRSKEIANMLETSSHGKELSAFNNIADAYFGKGDVDAIISNNQIFKPRKDDSVAVGTALPDAGTNTNIAVGKLTEYLAKGQNNKTPTAQSDNGQTIKILSSILSAIQQQAYTLYRVASQQGNQQKATVNLNARQVGEVLNSQNAPQTKRQPNLT
jgi:lysozyme